MRERHEVAVFLAPMVVAAERIAWRLLLLLYSLAVCSCTPLYYLRNLLLLSLLYLLSVFLLQIPYDNTAPEMPRDASLQHGRHGPAPARCRLCLSLLTCCVAVQCSTAGIGGGLWAVGVWRGSGERLWRVRLLAIQCMQYSVVRQGQRRYV